MATGTLGLLLGLKDLIFEKRAAKSTKPSILKDLIDDPENFKLEASVEGGDLVVRISRKVASKMLLAKKT